MTSGSSNLNDLQERNCVDERSLIPSMGKSPSHGLLSLPISFHSLASFFSIALLCYRVQHREPKHAT